MISLLVPIRGESEAASAAFEGLGDDFELIVADGSDPGAAAGGFLKIGARLISLPGRDRGTRLAAAARSASGGVFVFLHCDTVLPRGARELIEG
ncbi:MAG: hypothetical protein ACRD16_16790, partial [Thermoanaerobaculia bacterium]